MPNTLEPLVKMSRKRAEYSEIKKNKLQFIDRIKIWKEFQILFNWVEPALSWCSFVDLLLGEKLIWLLARMKLSANTRKVNGSHFECLWSRKKLTFSFCLKHSLFVPSPLVSSFCFCHVTGINFKEFILFN